MSRAAFALVILVAACLPSEGSPHRSHAAVAAFKRAHPCPDNGATRGRCPGWIIDHVVPLCAGGADAPSNMQWQTAADAKLKDRDERRACRKR